MNLLDVAVGPIYLLLGVGIFLMVTIVFLLVFFAVKMIISIKKDNDSNVD